jgi:hypothetical protein
MVGASHPHIAKVREELEKSGDVETVTTSIDTKGRKQPARLKRANPDCPDCGGNGYFRGGDSGRCHCVSSPAEAHAAARYHQEHEERLCVLAAEINRNHEAGVEIMRVEAERLVEKLIKTDIESARSLYRILDSTNVQALISTLRDALERESLRRVAP